MCEQNRTKVNKAEIAEYVNLLVSGWFVYEYSAFEEARLRALEARIKRDCGKAFQARLYRRTQDVIDTIRQSGAKADTADAYEFTPTVIYQL